MLINGQFRIEKVQVLNWGGYSDLQVMHVERSEDRGAGTFDMHDL